MDMEAVAAGGGAGLTGWQAAALSGAAGWVWAASYFDLTRRTRALAQPWVTRRVHAETPAILRFQRMQHKLLDNFFCVLSCVVSVPFYTGFLPLLFWSGHGKLARQMTLLMAFCDYLGNVVKDLVSAPRPCSPPVRRVTATQDEKEHAMEYGLPSSHALMTVCLTGYMLHYVLSYGACDGFMITTGLSLTFLFVTLVGIARVYLGMHSLMDVIAGICLGVVILAFWLVVDDHVDAFVVSGQNVTFFWASLSLLLSFAYPEPEFPTPSFEFHTAFNGVSFGIVYGVQQTYLRFHGPDAALILSQQLPLLAYIGRVLVGIPTILAVKSCSKALSKWLLPVMCSTLGIPIVSSCYVPALKAPSSSSGKSSDPKQAGYFQKVFSLLPQKAYDVDTGIRFVQYAGLAWSVVDLVPVYGVQQTYSRFHGPDAALILSQQLPLLAYAGRVLVGIPTILAVKSCSKALSKWLLPVMCSTLGIPIVSSCYVPALKAPSSGPCKSSDPKQAGYFQKVFSLLPQKAYDVDTGIRFVQYAGLAWSVVDLVPVIFTHLNL